MSAPIRQRLVNPRLGTYLSIFASALVSLVLLYMIFEQMKPPPDVPLIWIVYAPVIAFVVVGLASAAMGAEGYYVAARSVPAFFNGLVLSATAVGGTGIAAITGTLLLSGYDGLALALGVMLGVMLTATMLAPYLRKYGGYTAPAYLGRRFSSRAVRLAAGAILAVPAMMILVAEFKLGIWLVTAVTGLEREQVTGVGALALLAVVVRGGMRGVTWSGAAAGVTVLLALLAPLFILSVKITSLPVPQITYGSLLGEVSRLEAAGGLANRTLPPFAVALPGDAPQTFVKPFLPAFGSLGSGSFVALALIIMAGTAVLPSVLARAGTTPNVFDARKAMGWNAVIIGLILLSLPAHAVFTRYLLMKGVIAPGASDLPDWFVWLQSIGLADLSGERTASFASLEIARDAGALLLPLAGGLPVALAYLTMAGLLAAAFAGASVRVLAVSNILADDLLYGAIYRNAHAERGRMNLARLLAVVVVVLAGYLALATGGDPLRLLLYGINIAGAAALPVMVFSIWWKRVNAFGAFAGLVSGASVSGLYILAVEAGMLTPAVALDPVLAGVFALPVSILITVGVSLATPRPDRAARDFVRELRVPGGETIYDREYRMSVPSRQRSV